MKVEYFVFNAFQENTYVLYNTSNNCIIIDPGCSTEEERSRLINFIESRKLTPIHLINTHCHLDHIFGNKFISEKYNLELKANKEEQYNIDMSIEVSNKYGLNMDQSPSISYFLEEKDIIELGDDKLEIIYTPGHSSGGICLYNRLENFVVAGDTLFQNSIGRTDLPGGNYNLLIESIKNKLLILPENTIVYNGHGESTTIGNEKKYNPFLK